MESDTERWPLASGVWTRRTGSLDWTLDRLSTGTPVPSAAAADLADWLGARCSGAAEPASFPPEFRFAPTDGAPLAAPSRPASVAWVAPYGAAVLPSGPGATAATRGLRRTGFALQPLPEGAALSETDDAPHTLTLPPPGRYEFCVVRAGAERDVLLAIDLDKGAIYVHAALGGVWLALEPAAAGPFAEGALNGDLRGMEVTQDGAATAIHLPTVAGLAVVRPDVRSLAFTVEYVGDGSARGAPIGWAGDVWCPVGGPAGMRLVSGSGRSVELAGPGPDPAVRFGPPVCDARHVSWPAVTGQLVARKSPEGVFVAHWVDWPVGVTPRFEFGSPYLSRSGSFWQLCWSESADSYAYVQSGRPNPDLHRVDSPRFCTGSSSFQRGQLVPGEPWLDHDRAYDARSDEVAIGLVESAAHEGVLSIVIESTAAATDLLASRDRQRAVLQYQAGDSPDLRFATLQVARPWEARVFVHDERLWVYHPDLAVASGWRVVAT